MSNTLYPKPPRRRRDRSHLRWRVEYHHMVYEGGGTASWNGYHRTRLGAHIAAWWTQNVSSYGGEVTLTDQHDSAGPFSD